MSHLCNTAGQMISFVSKQLNSSIAQLMFNRINGKGHLKCYQTVNHLLNSYQNLVAVRQQEESID